MNPFAQHLALLADDARFRALASDSSGTLAQLSLWLLELHLPTGSETRLLYGWVVPSPGEVTGHWAATKPDWKKLEPGSATAGEYRMVRLTLTALPRHVNAVLKGLGEARTLSESCAVAGLSAPEFFGELRLGEDAGAVARRYAPGPIRFLSPSVTGPSRVRTRQPLTSPSSSSPVRSCAVTDARKIELWVKQRGPGSPPPGARPTRDTLPGADDLARGCLEYLESETGLVFTGADAKRLGDIEWICPSATDVFENKFVTVRTRRERDEDDEIIAKAVQVSVHPGPLPTGTRLLARCRLYYGEEVAHDECRHTSVGGPLLEFPCTSELTRILVTIWYLDKNDNAHIWFESDSPLIREMSMGMGVSGLKGHLETPWTQSMERAHKQVKERAAKVRAIDQVSYRISSTGKRSSRELAEQAASALAARLFPERSEARFFPKGWDKQEGPGLLGFVEWFRELTDDASATAFVIVDPFFDDVGIYEFLGRARGTQAEYVVLTNTQVPSKDDESPKGEPKKKPRRERIPETCKNLLGVLAQLRLTVLDLQSKGNNRDELFHDRYILVYGDEAQLVKGFVLSNSLQGATRNAPLLVVPIPPDTLESVGEYIAALRAADPQVVPNAQLVTLFASGAERKGRLQQPGPKGVPDAALFFSRLLGDPALEGLDEMRLRTSLEAAHLLVNGRYEPSPAALQVLDPFIEQMITADEATFLRLWMALSSWRAELQGERRAFEEELARRMPRLASRLEQLLASAPWRDAPFGTKGVALDPGAIGLGHLFFRPYAQVLDDAQSLDSYRFRYYGEQNRSVRSAVNDLAEVAPERLVGVVEQVAVRLPPEAQRHSNDPAHVAAMHVLLPALGAIVDALHDDNGGALTSRMFRSSIPFMRALATARVAHAATVSDALQQLQQLELTERLVALAEMTSELRVQANRNDFQETEDVRTVRMQLFDALIALWPPSPEGAQQLPLVSRLGGPGEAGWALSTTQELLAPLVTAGKLTWDDVLKHWGTLLETRLKSLIGTEPRSYMFNQHEDPDLSEAVAWSLVRATREAREAQLKAIRAVVDKARRQLAVPFARSRDYTRWSGARDELEWVWATAGLILLAGSAELPAAELEPWRELLQLIQPLLERAPKGHTVALQEFRNEVSEQLGRATSLP
ncbi:VPA1262 family protein [Hyalangium minutum]|uniref:Uncharacterized protein n=1 Tax=Hyalangium minutum TaxID=394096 RepID=A0A085WKP8_9BACT|nr:VPA1262 family protein [Hyalangium minutum]KFE68261.1 hypothetical protein DB31_7498 [Hyalangium minutum]